MKYCLLLLLFTWCSLSGQAQNQVRVAVQLEPQSKRFRCEYTLLLPADTAHSQVLLNLNKQFTIISVRSPRMKELRIEPYLYPVFQDTLQGIKLRYGASDKRQKQITVVYEGTLSAKYATDQVMELSGHTNWLPILPYKEYEVVQYELDVRVPLAYSVISTQPPTRQSAGRYRFRGTTAATELTAIAAKKFYQLSSATSSRAITVYKAGAPLLRADTLLLTEAEKIIDFYNESIGRQDAIRRFSVLLPGTNRDAFGLRDNATTITYADFDVRKREDQVVLAHEISHKWWSNGSFNNYNDWLNEAFATYSSLLYLRATGDTAGFRQELATRIQAATNAPAILGFDKTKHDYPTYRRVIYAKGTAVLSALHNRLGDEKFIAILAATVAQKTATTEAFLALVAQEAGEETRRWLTKELTQ
jgi:hypothetical protein